MKVQFIDYGNEETVPFNQLRQTITFSHIPIQCHRAVLHGIVPVGSLLLALKFDLEIFIIFG